jgi:EamA domain-containing membrane protein RarD
VLQRRCTAFALHHLGFLQYLAPTLVLLQAVLLFGEHLSSST